AGSNRTCLSRCLPDSRSQDQSLSLFAARESRPSGDQGGSRPHRGKMKSNLRARIAAEFLGTAFLVAAVVGSGIMAEGLAAGNVALALLANSIATGAALVALILTFGPISGAHLNPVVSFADAMEGGLAWSETLPYITAQISGGVCGKIVADAMFGLPLLSLSSHVRGGPAQFLSEFIATFGLLSVI